MASLSDKIKALSSASVVKEHTIEEPAVANVMTLDEPIAGYDGLAYSGEETWTLNESYKNTKNNSYGYKYEDADFSYVDEKKTVTINPNQINLTQEDSSQYIPFEMFRYYDGIDLMHTSMRMSIYFVNEQGASGESDPINVEYSDTKIRFGFLVSKEATALKGKLKLEIHVKGNNPFGGNYLLKTRPNDEIVILESLHGNGKVIVDEEWSTNVIEDVRDAANQAKAANASAQQALASIDSKIADVSGTIAGNVKNELETTTLKNYYTKTETYSKAEVDKKIEDIDISEELKSYALKTELPTKVSELENDKGYLTEHQSLDAYALKDDLNGLATEQFVKDEVAKVDVSEQLKDYAKIENVYDKDTVDDKLANVKVDLTGYAKETYVTGITDVLRTDINTNKGDIQTINTAITNINQTLDSIDKSPNAYYTTTYNEPYTFEGTEYTGENTLVVYEIYNKDKENETRTAIAAHVIQGGSGSGSSNIISIERITGSPFVVTSNDKIIISYKFIGTDISGEDISQGNATWKLGNQVIKTEKIYTGENSVDLTDFIYTGSDQKITLIITDDIGTISQKSWYVSVVDVKLTSTFDDTRYYKAGSPVSFTYTPYGAIDKTVHFLLDGEEIDTITSTKGAAGLSTSYTIPTQLHGTHLFEMYMTATINNNDIESNHIIKDVIWYDETSDVPVIGCVYQEFTARQYEATNIVFTVYDSSTETPTVNLKATYVDTDGNTIETYNSNITMTSNTDTWQFKTDVIGTHTLTITCGETVKTLVATIIDLGIEVSPTTAGLEFDFNPVGYSNNDENRIWSDSNTGVSMTVSDNFDWVNGGYHIDDAGDQYFCIKAGTTATINYNLFADDAKVNGKEFKAIFKTTNVKKRDTSFISCMDSGIGLDMKVESANIYSSNASLYSPYCEEDIIEFEFNINKNTDIPMVLTYEDGVGNRPMIYTSDASFWQTTPQPIVIGSENCDVHIYRMKAYSTALSDKDILNNFIADARNAEEMIARYERNQIYKDGELNPEYLAEVCPDLRIIMVDTPWFTNDKDNKIDDTNITMIYKNGDPVLDNWTCTGARHRGQGTSSNEYGYAGRNIDLVMDTDTSLFTLGDGITTSSTITLTRESVPTDYLNVKVNIASSENQNNAQMARRYNTYNPFKRVAKHKDAFVKDTMEFFNCVVFIRERNEDINTHREFLDTNWHYYALGNVGDSKKTDDTRVNDKNDPLECVVEITDYNVPLAEFPTGKDGICPESEWKSGNTAYDFLYADYEYEDGEFKSFGSGSYEFRYEMKKISDEQRQVNIDTWREMYKFIVTSSDEEFYSRLKEWFVVDSALYFYLFTERYTMVDNRAKNSFWHYGKVYISNAEATTLGEDAGGYIIDDVQAAIRNGYRYDLTFCYDCDTSLGIDNTGKLVLTYGKEDTDFYVDGDSTSGYIYRAAESTFFSRVRDLFASELQAMFVDRENQNAWSADGLIKQWDDAQSQFPEEIWRLDIQRKYLRTYQGISIDNSKAGEANPRFLTEMLNGRKKYQRRMFERNQELYMATKYFGKVATQDQIMMRFNNPVGATIAPDFTLYITPYSDMYIGVSFGNVTPVNFRAKAGIEYTVPCSIESGTADITLIYGASFIQAIGDLSKCYVGDNDFSKASRLQSLVIGSNVNGYNNSFMTKISLGNNKLLEYLDIRNITGLNSVVDLSACGNLLELYAQGSGATGVIFANGGKLQKAYIPSVTSLTMKNLNNLEEFVIESYDNLQTLVVEYTPFINTLEVVNSATGLKVLRLVGMDWTLENTDTLNRVLTLRGIDNTGAEIALSVLIGDAFVPVVKQQELSAYNTAWNNLNVTYTTFIPQFAATFVNADGSILDVQYIDKGYMPVDPTTRAENPITTPVQESTVDKVFTFTGWDKEFVAMHEPMTFTAVYSSSTREYTIKYVSEFEGNPLQITTAPYGSIVEYEYDIPTYTALEGQSGGYRYYLFSRWDKSGYVNGDKTINAVFDHCDYTGSGYFEGREFNDLRPVEKYMTLKLNASGDIDISKYVDVLDELTFEMGEDYDFDEIESKILIKNGTYLDTETHAVFTGSNYIDTGIQLMSEDRSFVLAVDFEFDSGNSTDATLMECYDANQSEGFKLVYNGTGSFKWSSNITPVSDVSNREMLVIRHVEGESDIHVYKSNFAGDYVEYTLVANGSRDYFTPITRNLVFGCSINLMGKPVSYASGTIHWAKVWYGDLGHNICSDIAKFTKEQISTQMCGYDRKILADGSGYGALSFLATHVLRHKSMMIKDGGTSGGWGVTVAKQWLNTRFYNGLPLWVKQLIKQVKVEYMVGGGSTATSSCDCYVFLPSVTSLTNNSPYSSEPYTNEEKAIYGDKCISYMTSPEDRVRTNHLGEAVEYWTRSVYVNNQTYFAKVVPLRANGDIYAFTTSGTELSLVIEFCM